MKIADKENKLSDFHTRKEEIIEELKNAQNNDLEDMVYRMELLCHELRDT